MRHVVIRLFVLIMFCLPVLANASAAWQQIERQRFTVIHAPELYDEAARVVFRLEQYLDRHFADFPVDGDIKPIPIVLFHEAHTSNGNVGMPPLRSHWYNKPAPLGGAEWFDMLAVHEGRHMVQYAQLFDHPTGKVLHLLFGQTGVALFSGLMLPTWFYEGDAVVSETQMTNVGRGRSAAFHLWLRTDWLNHEPYSYERHMMGTGFDRTPYQSPYVFGYFFVHYLQTEYDRLLLDRVVEQMATGKALNFDEAITNETGLTLTEHYQQLTTRLVEQWRSELDALTLTEVQTLQPAGVHHWRSWYPIGRLNGKQIAVEVDIEDGAFLTRLDAGQMTRLTEVPRALVSSYTHTWKQKTLFIANDQICAVIEVEHPSSRNQQRTNLQCWEEKTGWQTLVANTQLTSATFADDQFLVHEFLSDRSSQLVQLSLTGERLAVFPLPDRSLVYDLSPAAGGWVFVMQLDEGHGIFHINYRLDDLTLLKAADQENLRSPLLTNHWLVFTSDATGIDQVMSLSRLTGETYQIATRPYGSYFLNYQPGSEQLVLSDYTATGQQIIQLAFFDTPLPVDDWVVQAQTTPAADIAGSQTPIVSPETLPSYAVQPYRWQDNWWNPHSWWGMYDGDTLRAGIASTNVFQDLYIDVSLGVSPARNDWVGSLDVTHRLLSGTLVGAQLAREPFDESQSFNQFGLQLARPWLLEQGVVESQILPAAALNRVMTDSGTGLTFAGLQVSYSTKKQASYYDIASPLAWNATLAGQHVLETAGQTWSGVLSYRQRGLSPRQSVVLEGQVQSLTGDSLAIIEPSALFGTAVTEPFIARAGLSYQWNLGPIGKSWTPALYWRSQALSFKLAGQWTDETDWALGLGWSPKINLLRNDYIQLSPELSAHYLPVDEQWRVLFSLNLTDLPL